MASVIKLKRSTTGGSTPSGGALQAGELAINLADRKLFSSTNGSDIITISGDRYNIDTTAVTHTGGGATIRLTKDGAAYDDIDILGSSSVTVTRESNGAISLATTAGSSFAGDSGTAAPSSGTVTIAGGSGITTSGSGSTVTVAGDDASTSAKGVASFASADFAVSSGAVTIKALGVSNAQLAGSIADSKLATISTAGKVALSALEIDGASDIGADLVDADLIIVDDGAGGTEVKSALSRVKKYIYSAMSGDATASDSGALTIADSSVENDMLAGSIAAGKLAGSIPNAKISNPDIRLSSNTGSQFDVGLGETLNIVSGNASGVSVALSANTVTVSGVDASTAVKGVAKFDSGDFSVSSGAVTLKDGASVNIAGSAATLTTARAIALSGDVVGTANFDGSAGISISTTIQNNSVALGTDTTGNYVATVAGTANEITVSGSGSETAGVTIALPDNVTIGNNLTVTANTAVGGNLAVTGDLTVSGTTTTVSSTTVTVNDSALKLAANQTGNNADAVDIGFYGTYNASSTQKFAGLLRDASDGTFILFKDNQSEPTTTLNTSGTGHALAQLDCVIDGGTY